MNSKITINLFDTFEIRKNDEIILENLSNTRKTKVFLAYLVLNKQRVISHKELFELLWSGQEYSNPGTALRTLLYRYRNLISDSGYNALSESIISKRGAYQWNSDIDVAIDIDDFEDYANIGLNEAVSADNRMDCLKKAIELYKGPLLKEFEGEHWIVHKAVKYRDMFIIASSQYASLLKENGNNEEAIRVLNNAIEKAGHTDLIDMELDMISADGNDEVISEKYDIVKSQVYSMNGEVDVLQRNMEADDSEDTAFVCDFAMFKDVYHLQRRLLARTGETMFVSMLMVGYLNDEMSDNLRNERVMKALLDSTRKSLRCGDSICRYSDSCLAIMFPAGSFDDAKKIMERVRKKFLMTDNSSDIIISFRVRPLKNLKD